MTKKARGKLIVLLAVVVIVLILVFQNTEPAELEVLFWTVPMPRCVLLLTTFLLGFLGGLITFGCISLRKST